MVTVASPVVAVTATIEPPAPPAPPAPAATPEVPTPPVPPTPAVLLSITVLPLIVTFAFVVAFTTITDPPADEESPGAPVLL